MRRRDHDRPDGGTHDGVDTNAVAVDGHRLARQARAVELLAQTHRAGVLDADPGDSATGQYVRDQPAGLVLSPDRRHALLAWARDTGGLIVEDDYDAELRYDRTPVGALQGLGPDVVVHGGSVSKTLAPALRLGWLVLPEHLVKAFAEAKYATDLATGILEQATLADFLARGEMDRHIRRMATRYRARRDRLVTGIATHLPGWTVTGTSAGLHLVVHPRPEPDEVALAALAQRCGLDARPLSHYAVTELDRPGLVIGYGHRRPDALADGVMELARHLDRAA